MSHLTASDPVTPAATWTLIGPDGEVVQTVTTTHGHMELIDYDTLARYSAAHALLTDMDRCQHGRHKGDDCSGCKGPSKGNPWHSAYHARIGTTLSAQPIVIPTENLGDPAAWVDPNWPKGSSDD